MPCATAEDVPRPSDLSTFTGSTVTFGASPATPIELLTEATIVPATWVPWPWPSLRPFTPPSPEVSDPARIWPDGRSSCAATPVSTTATFTALLPRVVAHTVSACRRARPHMLDQRGSFVASALGASGASCGPVAPPDCSPSTSIERASTSTASSRGSRCALATRSFASSASAAVWVATTGAPPCRVTDVILRFEDGRLPSSFNAPSTISAGGASADAVGSRQSSSASTGGCVPTSTAAGGAAGSATTGLIIRRPHARANAVAAPPSLTER